jgi:hypothetical protein
VITFSNVVVIGDIYLNNPLGGRRPVM